MKKFCFVWVFGIVAGNLAFAGGGEARAGLLVRAYQAKKADWLGKLKAAKSLDEQRAIWGEKPDSEAMAQRLWQELAPALREGWMLNYAALLLKEAPRYANTRLNPENQTSPSPASRILEAAAIHHFKHPDIGRFCISLTLVPLPDTVKFLERVVESHPEQTARGQAALAQSILMADLGDDAKVTRKRLELLRQAVRDAAEVTVGEVTVGQLVENELYKIKFLARGREAPELKGVDLTGKQMALSDFRGKVVVLFFWNATMERAEASMRYMQKLHPKLEGKEAVLLGVATESMPILRKLEENKQLPWRNWVDSLGQRANTYRLTKWPTVYVLDKEGKIQYRGVADSFVEIAVQAQLAPASAVKPKAGR